ncbi:CPBP family intramembrane glutamic endopeptidase [Clostridium ganghwense]|uniref:CPBP family intramembrane metalloprotease n=1 Tax=Clostridium ganghwense TaxID=312089 RepID=A0ABT4CP82_9CLOT|nr:CPBP family intramembrane glutamic endopeptidase [Clostridium ganghwense]MCY6370870.1 CPBP family intramembrane metalloprotease [Clostridium ganghwense]
MKKFLYLVFYILKYLFIYILVQSLVTIITIFIMEKEIGLEGVDDLIIKYGFSTLPIAIIITFIGYYLLFKLDNEDLIKYCDFNKFKNQYILPIILISISFSLMTSCIAKSDVNILHIYGEILGSYFNGGNSISELICLLIFVPIFEEVLFRGIIYNKLRENIDLVSAIIVQASIFGIFHGNAFQTVYTGILGIILAIIYTWSDSIWAAILTHGVFNISGLIIVPGIINISKGVIPCYIPMYIVIGLIILIISFRYFYRITRPIKPFNSFFIEL